MRRGCMYRTMNVRGLRGTEVAYNSVDVTSYAAFVNSLTEEEKKKCHVEVVDGDFEIIGVRLSCENKKGIDVFNKVVQKAGNLLKLSYLDGCYNRTYNDDYDEDDED